MPRLPNPQRIEKLEQQAERIARQLRKARAAEAKQTRDNDTRRKIISGALDEAHALKNPGSDFAKTHGGLLKEYVRPEDRWLFAEVFRTLLPADEAETLLAEGEVARAAADKAKAEKRATRPAVPEAAE
jgi:hypothetical protein